MQGIRQDPVLSRNPALMQPLRKPESRYASKRLWPTYCPSATPGGTMKIDDVVAQIFHEHIVTRHVLVDHRKTFRSLDKGNKEKARVEAPEFVIAIHEVVTTPQHLDAIIVVRMGPEHMGALVNLRIATLVSHGKVRIGEFVATGEWRTHALVAPGDAFLLFQAHGIPEISMVMATRRPTK